jgi:membrane protein DedA with SNARE-associated domain
MPKVNITVGHCLAVLLWLQALTASETSTAFSANFAFSAVAFSPPGIARVPIAVSKDLFHYCKEHIELKEISYAPFALPSLKVFSAGANFLTVTPHGMQHMTKDILTTKITKATKGSDIFAHKLRALCVHRGQICFFFLGCGSGGARFSAVDSSSSGALATPADHQQSPAVRRFERSLARVQPLLQRYGYGAAFAAVMVEGMGIPTPGQTLLMASAFEAAAGRMNITLLVFLVTVAATLGNSIGYAIGRWGGRKALSKLNVNLQRQQRLEDLFKRRGGVVILLARFLDGLRQLNGIVAGVLQMPWWTFTAYNVAGAILWTFAWGLGTYYLGRDIHFIAAFFHLHRPLLLALGATAFVALLVYLLRTRKVSSEQ